MISERMDKLVEALTRSGVAKVTAKWRGRDGQLYALAEIQAADGEVLQIDIKMGATP